MTVDQDFEHGRRAALIEKITKTVSTAKKFAIVKSTVYNLDIMIQIECSELTNEGRDWINSAIQLVHTSYGSSNLWVENLYGVLEYRFPDNEIIIQVVDQGGGGTITHFNPRSSQANFN